MKSQSLRNRSSCSGKEQFDTYRLADQAAGRRRRNHARMIVYHCNQCGKFHTGNAAVPKSAKRRPRFEE